MLLSMREGMALEWGQGRGEIIEAPTHFYLESMRLDQVHGHSARFLLCVDLYLCFDAIFLCYVKAAVFLGKVYSPHASNLNSPDKPTRLSTVITRARRSKQQDRAGLRQAIRPFPTDALLVCLHRPFSRRYTLVQRFAGRCDLRVNGGAERKAATGDATQRDGRYGRAIVCGALGSSS